MKQVIAVFSLTLAALAQAQGGPIRIGAINSYSSMPQFATPYRQGWQLALDLTSNEEVDVQAMRGLKVSTHLINPAF